MTIVLTLIALCFKVKPTRALEGGLKLGIAFNWYQCYYRNFNYCFLRCNGLFRRTYRNFFKYYRCWLGTFGHHHLGISLHPLLSLIMVIVNVIMLILNKTNTLDVDIFDIWHLSIVGLFAIFVAQT